MRSELAMSPQPVRKNALAIASACIVVALAAFPRAQPGDASSIDFPTSGSEAATPHFLRGVTALHNFEYEDANEAFVEAQRVDRNFAMAYWGEAMTYHQTLWRRENLEAGRQVLARLRSRPAAGRLEKETAWIRAVEVLFGAGSVEARRSRYADAMKRLHEADLGDPEAASFYALALMGTMARSLIGYVDPGEGHSHNLAGSGTQAEVARILEKVLAKNPQHPGALHYLLHNYDDPAHARLGLEAARAYRSIAASSHALHMPAHIFMQLGMWNEAALSDQASFAWSSARVKSKGLALAMRDYHSLSWLQYELLQLGRYREAQQTLGEIEPVVRETKSPILQSDLSSMRARYVVETRQWSLLSREQTFGNVNELFAIGMSAARSDNPSLAEMARQGLAERAGQEQEGDLRPAIAIMERQVAALIELAAGRRDAAVDILRAATEAELKLPPPLGLPIPVKPAPELLGEVLLEVGRPAEAVSWFEQSLSRNRNRSLSILGLARAAVALNHPEEAAAHYRGLLANFAQADPELAEVNEAHAALNPAAARVWWPGRGTVIGLALSVVALGAFLMWRSGHRKHRSPRPSHLSRAERRRRALGRR
jgi:tetratricopeptide (TPR) repeat protein